MDPGGGSTSVDGDFQAHVYGLEHSCDLDGNRTQLKFPHQFVTMQSYAWRATTGELTSATSPGHTIAFTYDVASRLTSTNIPAASRISGSTITIAACGGVEDFARMSGSPLTPLRHK